MCVSQTYFMFLMIQNGIRAFLKKMFSFHLRNSRLFKSRAREGRFSGEIIHLLSGGGTKKKQKKKQPSRVKNWRDSYQWHPLVKNYHCSHNMEQEKKNKWMLPKIVLTLWIMYSNVSRLHRIQQKLSCTRNRAAACSALWVNTACVKHMY